MCWVQIPKPPHFLVACILKYLCMLILKFTRILLLYGIATVCTIHSDVDGLASGHEPGQAKLGQNSGFLRALAQPRVLQSQSQAVRLWLVTM